jgi:endonuclease-3
MAPQIDGARVDSIIAALEREYPAALCSLEYDKDYELLFSVRLAAQCTDERVNKVTPALFERFPSLEAFAAADVAEVEQYIHSCGFYHGKARDIVLAANMLLSDFGGKVPGTMVELLKLPGVGRKTANLILGDVYGLPAYVVDTHCIRLTNRIGLVDVKEPVKIEAELRKLLPPDKASDFCHRMVLLVARFARRARRDARRAAFVSGVISAFDAPVLQSL